MCQCVKSLMHPRIADAWGFFDGGGDGNMTYIWQKIYTLMHGKLGGERVGGMLEGRERWGK